MTPFGNIYVYMKLLPLILEDEQNIIPLNDDVSIRYMPNNKYLRIQFNQNKDDFNNFDDEHIVVLKLHDVNRNEVVSHLKNNNSFQNEEGLITILKQKYITSKPLIVHTNMVMINVYPYMDYDLFRFAA